MALWGNQAILIQEEVTKLEKICDQQLGPDLDSLDKQRTEVKVSWTDRQTDRQTDRFTRTSMDLIWIH